MSTYSVADIVSALDQFHQVVQQAICDGTILTIMKREKKAMVGDSMAG